MFPVKLTVWVAHLESGPPSQNRFPSLMETVFLVHKKGMRVAAPGKAKSWL